MDMGNNSMSIKPSVPNDGIISHVYGALLSKDFSNLEQVLHHNWAVLVPQAFNKEIVAEERQALQSQLIYNIELFLSQSSTPKEVFAKLKAGNAPDLFCGRAFRNGEPTYSCRDCAYDPTCVLCMQCFEKSAHKSHKYRINTSSGGGYCDCGDVDAWKAFPACSEHGKAAATDNQNPESRLPEGMVQRAEVLFQCILRYSYQVLSSALDADLPDSLVEKNVLATDSYCTMLLNDEIHTYEQVISRLIKAVGVTNKEAVDFATTVDREGRAPVFTGPKATCQKLSQEIQKKFNLNDSKILEAAVMHHSFVSHQDFAQLLLKWLEEIIDYSDGLRKIFCRVAMVPDEDVSDISLLEKILLADTSFWKAVRLQFHQLFMTGVFKDVESKTQFAILLTKHYIDLYRDFVRDDHYRTVSATAVTVQAKVLIEKHRLIEVILKTLLKESERWKNDKGILDFQSRRDSEAYAIFKRAQFVIHDLKYALGCTLNNPQWTPDLQSSFINGFTTFLELLTQIQGMDAAKRFTTHHIEYEMEWETAFTLQLKLTDIITLFIQHCRTSPEVLVSAYTAILRYMPKYTIYTNEITIAGHSANCCVFDVGGPEKCVSIHLPLHRLLAGLNHHLPPDVNYTSPQFAPMNCQLQLFNLLEEPLRIQVMLAQIYSEMWKRNGYSIQSQMYYYMYVKCRPEMYDRDIQLIQSVAAVMEPDSFLIHVIHKYTLTSIFQNSDSQFTTLSVKQTTEIVREMLQLLIIILGERYVEGVGKVTPQQIVQREIIHLLAISRSSHSDLDKNMPEDVNSETQLENYVREVADFTRDSTGKGMYTLMDECRALFNPCFYHYSKADQSKAEDSQKMFRKNSGLDGALPIPFTPQWTERYSSVSRLFTCDVMLHVIHTLLSNMVAKRSRIRSESHLEKVLHLITLALHEDKHEFAAGNKSLPFTNAAQRYKGSSLYSSERLGSRELSILDLLNECQNSEHVTHAPLKDLLGYVLKYFSEVASMGHECGGSIVTKKRSTENLDSAAQAAIDKQKALRAKKAAKSRSKIIEKMMKAQQKFMDGAADLFQTCNVESEGAKETTPMDCSDSLAEESKTPVALGPNKSAARPHLENYVCILCQDASTIDDDTTVVYSAFVQRSTVLSRNSSHRNTQEDTPTDVSVLLVPSELSHGVFTTTCGHAMHASCFKIYHDSVVARERRRAQRALFQYLNPAFDFDKGEFFCPLCESIANCVLPVLPCAGRKDSSQSPPVCAVNLSNWLKILTQLAQPDSAMSSLEDNCPIPDLAKVAADTVYTNLMELYDFLSSSANQ
ncbi:UBR2 [Bugula neritina]|uniref:E3 ubiquitin-protein ligase n=1 Tax=Bugula neritina TaxID=10212 RepID=A0A7J7JFT2_BUGNE|nr:UBR2 [Bugula neritina]